MRHAWIWVSCHLGCSVSPGRSAGDGRRASKAIVGNCCGGVLGRQGRHAKCNDERIYDLEFDAEFRLIKKKLED
jgi:hypothetical protein